MTTESTDLHRSDSLPEGWRTLLLQISAHQDIDLQTGTTRLGVIRHVDDSKGVLEYVPSS